MMLVKKMTVAKRRVKNGGGLCILLNLFYNSARIGEKWQPKEAARSKKPR